MSSKDGQTSLRPSMLFDDESSYVDRFGLLLLVTTLAVITLSLVDLGGSFEDLRSDVGAILVTIFVGGTLLLSLRASGVARRYRRIADVLIGVGILATLIVAVVGMNVDESAGAATGSPSRVWVVLSLIAPVVVIRRLFHHKRATGQTLAGAISAFLLIAVAFNFVFLTVNAFAATPFFGSEEPTTSFMYFSLVTITSLGYGDLSAVEPFARLLTTLEALIGQVYLVTFVGMVVGLMVGQRQEKSHSG